MVGLASRTLAPESTEMQLLDFNQEYPGKPLGSWERSSGADSQEELDFYI